MKISTTAARRRPIKWRQGRHLSLIQASYKHKSLTNLPHPVVTAFQLTGVRTFPTAINLSFGSFPIHNSLFTSKPSSISQPLPPSTYTDSPLHFSASSFPLLFWVPATRPKATLATSSAVFMARLFSRKQVETARVSMPVSVARGQMAFMRMLWVAGRVYRSVRMRPRRPCLAVYGWGS